MLDNFNRIRDELSLAFINNINDRQNEVSGCRATYSITNLGYFTDLYSKGCKQAKNGDDFIWKLEQTATGNTRADSIPPARFSPRLRDSSCVLHSLDPMEFGCSSWSSYKMLQVYASILYESCHLEVQGRNCMLSSWSGIFLPTWETPCVLLIHDLHSPCLDEGVQHGISTRAPAAIRPLIRFIYCIWTFGQNIQLITYDQAKRKFAGAASIPVSWPNTCLFICFQMRSYIKNYVHCFNLFYVFHVFPCAISAI